MRQPTDLYLGIEGGATRTVALIASGNGEAIQRVEAGPANLKLLSDSQLVNHLRSLATQLPRPRALAIGLAGAWSRADGQRICTAAAKVWPRIPCHATSDLETALMAATDGHQTTTATAKVLLVSGTGSCCYGKRPDGHAIKVGGWGHILGDKGSGYEIGLRGLKAAIYYYDQTGVWPKLGRRILRALQFNEPNDLISWAQQASKAEMASLALEVLAAWDEKDNIAEDILAAAANSLARDAATCAERLLRGHKITKARNRRTTALQGLEFIFAGSILLKQPRFAARVSRELQKLCPKALIQPLAQEGVWGAVALARQLVHSDSRITHHAPPGTQHPAQLEVKSTKLSPTEQRHSASMNLDRMSLDAAVRLMLREDAKICRRLIGHRKAIVQTIQAIIRAFRNGGHLFYVGAGTSGRLGILDASECPPTFRAPPDQVQAIIAGGQPAIWTSIEGAEDDVGAGQSAIVFRQVSRKDVVIGLAASGTTPFVWGALAEARRRKATTILVCFNPFLEVPRPLRPNIIIAPNLGPELLTGSTRLNAGTATKLLLNMFTTLAMVHTGKVISNLMVDLFAANRKLKDRATRIVQQLTGADYDRAQTALRSNDWIIKKAVARLTRKASLRA
jgi:N-acetylmuramic acid 6-phosphate etherase